MSRRIDARPSSSTRISGRAGPGRHPARPRRSRGGGDRPDPAPERGHPLGCYCAEIRDFGLLTAEQERSLGEASRRGDRDARDRLVTANLRLVIRIAGDFVGRGLPLEDLVGEGNLGLMRAASLYDPSFGTRFSTYANFWIKQAIRHALITTTAPIRLPSHLVGLVTKWHRAEREFLRTFGFPPDPEQVAARLGIGPAKRRMIEQALRAGRFVGGEPDDRADLLDQAPADQARPEDPIEAEEQRQVLSRRLRRLDDRERLVLALHLGLGGQPPRNLREIGERLGITRDWVRKIERTALRKLSRPEEACIAPPRSGPAARPEPAFVSACFADAGDRPLPEPPALFDLALPA